jgi:tryptophan-rich sensory protein
MKTKAQYRIYKKPSWAPPSWLFGPVWTVLYILIAISYGAVLYACIRHEFGILILLPFVLNLIFNAAYTPLQFTLGNFWLALIDIFLVLGTLVWALVTIYPYIPWVSYINIPYLLWVSFATVLQCTITYLNRKVRL